MASTDLGVTQLPNAFPGLTAMRWEAGGRVWDLLGGGPVVISNGVRGLNAPVHNGFRSSSPGVNGSRWAGHRVEQREVFWPVFVYTDESSYKWIELDRAFWSTLHPEKTGRWCVVHPDGTERFLTLRFDSDGGHTTSVDPSLRGWELYGITLIAEQPFWQAARPIRRVWKAGTPVNFFGPTGKGAPFFISPGQTLSTARIDNPGDEPAYIKWKITGPTTSVKVGVGGLTDHVPFAIAAGETLTIDTHPSQMTAISSIHGDRTRDLGEVSFAAIPPGVEVQLTLTMSGSGMIEASFHPLYRRAW